MKITTWNVNGLRAVLNRGSLNWLGRVRPDVICLQEIKVQPGQLTEEQRRVWEGYYEIWHPAQRPGYSGVATLAREEPAEITIGVGSEPFDCEGRCIQTRHGDFILYNNYFPSGQRGMERVAFKLEYYAHLLKMIDLNHAASQNVVLCGDFNTAHREIDLRNPKQNITTSGFLPEERAWIDKYLEHGLVDAFRELYPERAEYTWWTYRSGARQRNIGWRLDYFLVSRALLPRVKEVLIHGDLDGSDHCPVSIVLD